MNKLLELCGLVTGVMTFFLILLHRVVRKAEVQHSDEDPANDNIAEVDLRPLVVSEKWANIIRNDGPRTVLKDGTGKLEVEFWRRRR